MAYTSLQATPAIGDVGAPATFVAVGQPSGNDPRWYVATAPGASALPTLATSADPEAARLPVDAAGHGQLTPDAPGFYTVQLQEAQTTLALAHFQDPLSPPRTPADVILSTLTSNVYWVAQTIARPLGTAPDTATLSIRTYDQQVDTTYAGAVTISRPSTPVMKLALAQPEVGDVVADLQGELFLLDNLTVQAWSLAQIGSAWNGHAGATSRNVHLVVDADVLGAVVPASLDPAAIGAALLALVTAFNSHSTDNAAHYGTDPDFGNTLIDVTTTSWFSPSAPALADLARLTNRLDQSFRHHVTVYGPHGDAGDGSYAEWNEPARPRAQSLYEVISRLGQQLAGHQQHTSRTIHQVADASNFPNALLVPNLSSPEFLYGYLNTIADAINRHVQNQTTAGAALTGSSSYHFKAGQRVISQRASSALTAAQTAEQIALVTEEHFLDTALHGAGDLGTNSYLFLSSVFNADLSTPTRYRQQVAWPYTLRLAKLLRRALASLPPVLPAASNRAAAAPLLSLGWT